MRKLFRTSAAAIAAASLGLAFAAATPAGAASVGSPAPRAVAPRVHPRHGQANLTSSTFAGYAKAIAATSASTSFKIPTLTGCTVGTSQGIASGVQIFNTNNLDFSAAQIFEFCNGASPAYLADIIIDGSEADYAITLNPGDRVSMSITESTTSTTVKVTDSTSRKSATSTVTVGDTMNEVSVGDSALFFLNGVQGGVPNFGSVTFGPSKINNAALNTLSPTAFDMVAPPSTVQITTGALTTTFKTTFQHS